MRTSEESKATSKSLRLALKPLSLNILVEVPVGCLHAC